MKFLECIYPSHNNVRQTTDIKTKAQFHDFNLHRIHFIANISSCQNVFFLFFHFKLTRKLNFWHFSYDETTKKNLEIKLNFNFETKLLWESRKVSESVRFWLSFQCVEDFFSMEYKRRKNRQGLIIQSRKKKQIQKVTRTMLKGHT